MYPFQVYTDGVLRDGIKAAYLETLALDRIDYYNKLLRTWQGDFTVQHSPELDKLFQHNPTVRVIGSFQIREHDRVVVCRVQKQRDYHAS